VVTHDEQLGITSLRRFPIELKRPLVKPSGPWFEIVSEGKPEVEKLLNVSIVRPSQINDVGYSEGSQLLHVGLGLYCASEREPFAHEESFHRVGPLSIPNRPRRLENLYFVNAVFVQPAPLNRVTCNLPVRWDF
jgi:hypothetical protein